MLQDFINYINKYHLARKGSKILLTVSGGIDSMVMTRLFLEAGYETGIAHCNFSLRGKESDRDEDMVKKFAEKHKIPFFTTRFPTREYADKNGISIQMAARDLRYKWFEEIRISNGYDQIAVAHNLNDNIETLLINLTRGSGISGLSGIKKSNGHVIRPLLFATRESIEKYATKHRIRYREDSSNAETKYARNKIRHLVLPVLKEINPDIEHTLNETTERLGETGEIVAKYISNIRELISISHQKDIIITDIRKLQPYLENSSILYELFCDFGITNNLLKDLYAVISGKTGSFLVSSSHRFLKNRNELIITGLPGTKNKDVILRNISELRKYPAFTAVRLGRFRNDLKIPADPDTACLDYQKIIFPVTIRSWHKGDFFFPFGMDQKKKLSDYFTDQKYSVPEKEDTLLMESEGNIVWIIGERIDNRFRITELTKSVLLIKVVIERGTQCDSV